VAGNTVPRDEALRIKHAMAQAARAIQSRHGRATAALIASLTGASVATVSAYQKGVRRPTVEFAKRLAVAAGMPVTRLFVTLGWLPPDELAVADRAQMATELITAAATLNRLEFHARQALEVVRLPAPAPFAAMAAVLGDPGGGSRFAATMSQVISGWQFPMITNTVVEFTLRPGAKPLSPGELEDLARRSGLVYRPHPTLMARDPDYWSVKLELMARANQTLHGADLGHYSWQGEPGTTTWLDVAKQRPAHLLVQAPYGCVRRPAAADPWRPSQPTTLLLVGGRYSLAHAAALLAEALGWEFAPVRRRMDVTDSGAVVPVARERIGGGVLAWNSVAQYIERRHAAGSPWLAVVLLRPRTLRGRHGVEARALEYLERTPATVVYLKPPREFVVWWARRQRGSNPLADLDVDRLAERTLEELARIEDVMRSRHGRHDDLCLSLPDPGGPLPAKSAQIPAEIIDVQPAIVYEILKWVDETINRDGMSVIARLRPSSLTAWLPSLADVTSALPAGTVPRRVSPHSWAEE
jgi:transcriptional regulator with XRE-family HTH domain